MKNLYSFFAAVLLLTVAAQAQTGSFAALPGDPSATMIARLPMTTEVSTDILGKKKTETVSNEVFVWRTGTGTVSLTMNTPSIAPTTGTGIDYLPTREVFKQISANAVAEVVRHGFITQSAPVTLWHESNVVRTGSGMATRYEVCSSYTAISRNYTVNMAGGDTTVTDLSTNAYPNACGSTGGIQ